MKKQSFRRATAADAGTVRDITHAAYTKWIAVIGRKPKPMTADYDKAVAAHVIDLLEEDGRTIALIEMIPEPSHLLIENIAVMPERQVAALSVASWFETRQRVRAKRGPMTGSAMRLEGWSHRCGNCFK